MFKRLCFICGSEVDTFYPLCSSCMPKALEPENVCSMCGIPTNKFVRLCVSCNGNNFHFNNNYSLFYYSSIGKLTLNLYKFKTETSFNYYYAQLLQAYILKEFTDPLICPVPTSFIKRRLKGGYQLDPIISELKKHGLNIKQLLVKKFSKTQKKLNRSDRYNNLRNKFAVRKHKLHRVKEIVLLDDVFTTGATADSCAEVLKDFGYSNIYVITLYRD